MEFAYVITTIITILFFVGSFAIIYSIIFEMPTYYNYKPKKQTEKKEVILDISLLSGIDINDNSDIHADFDEVD